MIMSTSTTTPEPAPAEHKTFLQIWTDKAPVFHQTYNLVIGKLKSQIVTLKAGGSKNIVELNVSDGTASMKFTQWDVQASNFKEGQGIKVEGAYIKFKDGWPELKFSHPSKGGSVKFFPMTQLSPIKFVATPDHLKPSKTNTAASESPMPGPSDKWIQTLEEIRVYVQSIAEKLGCATPTATPMNLSSVDPSLDLNAEPAEPDDEMFEAPPVGTTSNDQSVYRIIGEKQYFVIPPGFYTILKTTEKATGIQLNGAIGPVYIPKSQGWDDPTHGFVIPKWMVDQKPESFRWW
jgi:uncharacterized protein YodC (DUF2158 family)